MQIQKEISKQKQEEKKGKIFKVLVEEKTFDNKYLIGRTMQDVPDIDGLVYIKNNDIAQKVLNKFINCDIIDISNYDLIAKVCE